MSKQKIDRAPELNELKTELKRVRYRQGFASVMRSTLFTLVVVAAFAILVATLWLPVLQIAVGHLEWSSLPVGGESTHCLLSGHRGLPSAKLFTDLDKVVVGDLFMLRILDEILTYEVDQISIVLPHETDSLLIEEGKDLCTLITCTPYGVNTHRILVRGHRVENLASSRKIRITAEAIQIEPLLVAPVVASPILLILLIMLMIPPKPKYRSRSEHNEEDDS